MRRAAALLALALSGCGLSGGVVRVYDGRVVEGGYVPPEAYAAYLRGALAEASGDLAAATAAFAQAAQADDEDPEIWARLGDARCRSNAKDRGADDAFERARRLDPGYAGLLVARSRCAGLRGEDDAAAALATEASREDPRSVPIDALVVRAEARRGNHGSRERAIALTLAHGERAEAWGALAAWGAARHDTTLRARGLVGLLGAAPARAAEVEAGARELMGEGHAAAARMVAAAIVDASRDRLVRGPRDEVVARLAVDEGLARGDEAAALRRATRGRVEISEVAARALILERRDLAARLARAVANADPGAGGARMVLAALESRPVDAARRVTDEPAGLCAMVLADRIATVAGPDVARVWLSQIPWREIAKHDPLGKLAVDLAARGVLVAEQLSPGQRVELAARLREPPPRIAEEEPLDARHELLRAALIAPGSAEARALFARLESAVAIDPIIAFAGARLALEAGLGGETRTFARVREAASMFPSDALLLAAALDVAKRAGSARELDPLRARLFAVAQTPAERALARE